MRDIDTNVEKIRPGWLPGCQLRARYGLLTRLIGVAFVALFLCLLPLGTSQSSNSVRTDGSFEAKVGRYFSVPEFRPAAPLILLAEEREKKKKPRSSNKPSAKKQVPTSRKKTVPAAKNKPKPAPKKKIRKAPRKKAKPAPKKRKTVPVIRKKKAPVPKKKTVPAPKKKPNPAPRKTEPAKKQPPAETTDPVRTAPSKTVPVPKVPGTTDQQQDENERFCAKNPNDPSCSKEKQPPPATEKICSANPKYPGCDAFGTGPDLNRPADDVKVPSFCEQNPQLPQCQQERPDDAAAEPEQSDQDDQADLPDIPSNPPISPGPPTPPPAETESEDAVPAGPQVQTVIVCPDGQYELDGACVEQCPVDNRFVLNGQCFPVCPEGSYSDGVTTQCMNSCPADSVVVDGSNYDECLAQCPDGLELFAGVCRLSGQCPEGQVSIEGQCAVSCPGNSVERLGVCIGQSFCTGQGGTVYNNEQCVEQCPAGASTYNDRCFDQCPEGTGDLGDGTCGVCPSGQDDLNGACIAACPIGSIREGEQCVPVQCPDGEEVVANTCAEICPAGTVRLELQCVTDYSCPEGQYQVDGTCSPITDISYEDYVEECAGRIESGDPFSTTIPDGVSPQQACEADVAQQCQDIGGSASVTSGYRICTERPCGEGLENAGGQCLSPCGEGQERGSDGLCHCPGGQVRLENGTCSASCSEGTYLNQDGQCYAECPGWSNVLNGQCLPGLCPTGYENQDGICIAECSPGEVRGADGTCGNPCPEGQSHLSVWNSCENQCPEGQLQSVSGGCSAQCNPEQNAVESNGYCVGRGDAPYEAILEDCLSGGGLANGEAGLDAATCNERIVEQCESSRDLTIGNMRDMPRWCGDIANPSTGTYDPPPVEVADTEETAPGSEETAPAEQTEQPAPEETEPAPAEGELEPEGQSVEDWIAECMAGTNAAGNNPSSGECLENLGDECSAANQQSPPRHCVEIIEEQGTPAPAEENEPSPDEQTEQPAPDDAKPEPTEGEQPTEDTEPVPVDDPQQPAPDDTEQPPAEDTEPAPTDDQQQTPPGDEEPVPEDEPQPPAPDDAEQPPADEEPVPADDPQPPEPDDTEQPPTEDPEPVPEGEQDQTVPDEAEPAPADDAEPPAPTDDETRQPPQDDVTPPAKKPVPDGASKPKAPAPAEISKPVTESAPAIEPDESQTPLAIVISNARYRVKGVPDKPQAAAGADIFTVMLERDFGLPRSKIIGLADPRQRDLEAVFGMPGAPASHLQTALSFAPSSEVILYYSGHALPVDGGVDAVLLPADGDPADAALTGYRLSLLYRNAQALGIARLRIYLDTAFNSDLAASPSANAPSPRSVVTYPPASLGGAPVPAGWVVVSAASGDQPVFTAPDQPVGTFTAALVSGLRGEADSSGPGNSDGAVTAGELAAYLQDKVSAAVRAATGGAQMPAAYYGRGDEVLVIHDGIDVPVPTENPRRTDLPDEPAVKKSEKPVAPSFDCAKARSRVEKTICASPEIARLDNEMAGLYLKRRRASKGSNRNALTQQQRQWQRTRNSCGSSTSCLIKTYGQRIEQLR